MVLGAVLLAFTGAEALYADMGHFGKRPIRIGWFALVLPALVLNYFGQGALLIANPAAIDNPFYLAFPGWALYPMVVARHRGHRHRLAGARSPAPPRSRDRRSSSASCRASTSCRPRRSAYGQIYIPALNWFLLVMVLAAVLGFGSSSDLAQAYGVALTGTMLVDHHPHLLRHPLRLALPAAGCASFATGFFFVIDLAFFSSAHAQGAATAAGSRSPSAPACSS